MFLFSPFSILHYQYAVVPPNSRICSNKTYMGYQLLVPFRATEALLKIQVFESDF